MNPSVTLRSRARGVGLLGVGTIAAAMLWPADAQAASVFNAEAEAYPFRMSTTNDGFPVVTTMEGYGPYARTKLNSLGTSDSVASAPYPGEIAAGGSGLLQSVTGIQVPDYPYFLLSASGDAPKEKNFPGVALQTQSGSGAAVARAVLGDDFSGGKASARSEVLADGGVAATAESAFELLEIGGNLSIQGLHTFARVVADANGKLTRTTDLRFDSLSAPAFRYETPCQVPPQISADPAALPCAKSVGPQFALANGKFFLLGPDGARQERPLGAEAAMNAFKSLGVTMTYQQPVVTKDGVIGAGLTVSYTLAGAPGSPPTTQTFAIGYSRAAATLRPDTTTSFGTSPSSADAASTFSSTPDAVFGPAQPDLAAGVLAPAAVPFTGATETAAVPAPGAAIPQVQIALAGASGRSTADAGDLYALLGLIAVLSFGAVPVVRMLGAR